jgi:hypothetical protein
VNESSKVSWFQQRRQQVGECWVVIFFVVKVEVDRLIVEVEGRGGFELRGKE